MFGQLFSDCPFSKKLTKSNSEFFNFCNNFYYHYSTTVSSIHTLFAGNTLLPIIGSLLLTVFINVSYISDCSSGVGILFNIEFWRALFLSSIIRFFSRSPTGTKLFTMTDDLTNRLAFMTTSSTSNVTTTYGVGTSGERGGRSFCSFGRYSDNQPLSSFSYFPDIPIILDICNLQKSFGGRFVSFFQRLHIC
ncbi:hypothetical protein AGLY_013172 [Aphis glycines]|uniref:Uncharacterized protein n=1 Tax=Aphis glycines TaxID=307491 RepID=A0A6G0T5K1_APHGL|nr:hypothetical protein AGLY_013172 [Aphis glycines]